MNRAPTYSIPFDEEIRRLPYDPEQHHRRSIRLPGYDYAQDGIYFVTICTAQRQPFFGTIEQGTMRLSALGKEITVVWSELPGHVPQVRLDAFVVMPNHVHGLIILVGAQSTAPPVQAHANSLGAVVRAFKAGSSRRLRSLGAESFGWQRNYYERIVRDDRSLDRTRRYIADNPDRWADDPENPERMTGIGTLLPIKPP